MQVFKVLYQNQLLFSHLTYDVKIAAKLQIIEPFTKETWEEFELFWK